MGSLMAIVAGASLGAMFYGGLWWTVQRIATSTRPATRVVASTVLRTSAALGGFYLVAGGDWRRLLLCLLGFVLARPVVTWLTRSPVPVSIRFGARDAP